MNTPNVHAGRLERRVRGWAEIRCRAFMDFALFSHSAQYAEYRYCALRPWGKQFRKRLAAAGKPPKLMIGAMMRGVLKSEKKFDPALHNA